MQFHANYEKYQSLVHRRASRPIKRKLIRFY